MGVYSRRALKRALRASFAFLALGLFGAAGQETSTGAAKPTLHTMGAVTATDPAAQTVTVKDDKIAAEREFSLTNTHTLLRVEPGAKDLKNAVRITAGDLAVGDRVDIRYFTADAEVNPTPARSVLLMSARDLARAHQEEAAAWQNSTAGTVVSIDPIASALQVSVRTPAGPKPITVKTSGETKFTRYSPDTPKTPASSQFGDIRPGDQVRVLGQKNDEAGTIEASKIYSGSFRTIPAVITSISADANQITVRDLQSKQSVQVSLNPDTMFRKLPPPMAVMLARRVNPAVRSAGTPDGSGGGPPSHWQGAGQGPAAGEGGMAGARSGDLSHMLERLPEINLSDLKPGDAVVITGAAKGEANQLIASAVIAGVEPIFQSAPPRQGQSLAGDWSLDMAIPAQ